jgi:hypothetical protein
VCALLDVGDGMPNAAVPAAAAAAVPRVEYHAGTRTIATTAAAARAASVATSPHRLPVRRVHRLRHAPFRLGKLPASRCTHRTLTRIHLTSNLPRLVVAPRETLDDARCAAEPPQTWHSSQVSESATGVYEARVAVLRSGTYQVHLSAQVGSLPEDGGPGDDVAPPLPLTVGAAEYVTASSKVRFRFLCSTTQRNSTPWFSCFILAPERNDEPVLESCVCLHRQCPERADSVHCDGRGTRW